MAGNPVTLEPIEGWGYSEAIDGSLAPQFRIAMTGTGVEFGDGVIGWTGAAIDGKYSGANVKVTPRHTEWDGIVVVKVEEAGTGRLLFYGMAESHGLEPSWKLLT
ncbi:hypothetical protein [Porphyrobacter sp. ULC335]|uniref:hypothetical protein n=1 Tax=Porphyrobacter sp. ULC335 TaxID=2854260 RepID=UPI00221FF5AF|nr:hypothetical protein [Porphyrobacter sp. ULC335]UYV15574.1 hypothetical protein KVF90_15985 [Porphyrobacter sp. ULC335]